MQPTKITPFRFAARDGMYEATEMSYQRNGVAGNGFFVVRFKSERSIQTYIGIVFDDECNPEQKMSVAVINPSDLSDHYRGDVFAQPLRECIEARKDEMWKSKGVPIR